MNPFRFVFATLMAASLAAAEPAVLFSEDFSKVPDGELPDPPFKLLDGQFKVMTEGDQHFVELPGSPLESYGFLFGPSQPTKEELDTRYGATARFDATAPAQSQTPSQPDTTAKPWKGVEASARILGTKSGRKFPTMALGLNGASGYRLQVSPAKNAIELFKGDNSVASAPFKWTSGEWTSLRLALRAGKDGSFQLEGSAWQGATAPTEPMVTFAETKLQPAGKAGAWGMPFSGTAIRFDDLKLIKLD